MVVEAASRELIPLIVAAAATIIIVCYKCSLLLLCSRFFFHFGEQGLGALKSSQMVGRLY